MEKINDLKFCQLSSDDMKNIEGGWGWKVMNVGYEKLVGADEGTSIISYQYHNIWGNAVEGKYRNEFD